MKTALLMAGQGAQSVGMGRELAAASPAAARVLEAADAAVGYKLTSICFEGPEAELTKTEHAQPALYAVGLAALAALKERVPGLAFEATAGLSLGEFTALAAAGAIDFADGVRLVRARGRFMQDACEATQGGMAAVIGLDEAAVREVCDATGVTLANLNCPGQIVISGPSDRIPAAVEAAKAKGARKAVALPVAGAYHSPLMTSARPKLAAQLAATVIRPPTVTVVSNVTALPHGDPDAIRKLLADQVTAPVRWEDSIRWLLAQGFRRFIEFGPGGALTGFMRRIDKTVEALTVGDAASLEATAKVLGA
jgi:[acyl-carrier-protein] S-malonyltransferase